MSKISNTEYRAVIKFFIWKGLSATEITKELIDVYGHSALSCSTVAKWVAEFNDPTWSFEDAPRSGRPPTPSDQWKYSSFWRGCDTHDRQISVRHIADELDISRTSLYEIMSDYLGMKKICTRWIPKHLTSLQLINRVECDKELLENCIQDPTRCFGRIVMEKRDINTPLRSTQPTRSKDLKGTRWKDTNSTTNHTIGWQDDHEYLLGLWRCSSRRFSITWYYNQWSMLRITPSPVTFFYSWETWQKLRYGVLLLHDNASVHKSSITQVSPNWIILHILQILHSSIIIYS